MRKPYSIADKPELPPTLAPNLAAQLLAQKKRAALALDVRPEAGDPLPETPEPSSSTKKGPR